MDARQEKGLVIAATLNIQPKGEKAWIVPSQTLTGRYTVTRTFDGLECTCLDYDSRHQTCKHGYAVEFFLKREMTIAPDGETTITETRAVRLTYAQNWPRYNAAQVAEKELFLHLLRDLCAALPQPERGMGRPSIPVADAIFSAAYKVYSGVSSRRFMTDLREASAQGHISRAWHYNTVLEVIEDEAITPMLHTLIAASSAPLASVESAFAVDSTGFGTSSFYRHFTAKHGGGEQASRNYLKLHALVGTKTNVIAAASVTDRDRHDYNEFAPLLIEGAKSFTIQEVSADKAYIGRSNLAAVAAVGAEAFIPFKSNAHDDPKSPLWSKMYHLYHYKQDEFLPVQETYPSETHPNGILPIVAASLNAAGIPFTENNSTAHYHQRSNSESAFSAIKRLLVAPYTQIAASKLRSTYLISFGGHTLTFQGQTLTFQGQTLRMTVWRNRRAGALRG